MNEIRGKAEQRTVVDDLETNDVMSVAGVEALSDAESFDMLTAGHDAAPMSASDASDVKEFGPDGVERRSSQRVASETLKRVSIFADIGALAAGIAGAVALTALLRPDSDGLIREHLALTAAGLPGFVAGAALNRLYLERANQRRLHEAANVLRAVAVGIGTMLGVAFAIQFKSLSRSYIAFLAILIVVAAMTERRWIRAWIRQLRESGRVQRRIIVVGTDPHAIGLLHAYERDPSLGYTVVGLVGDDDLGERAGVDVIGSVDDLSTLLKRYRANGVVVSLASVASDEVNVLTRRLTDDGYHVVLSSSLRDIDVSRLRPQSLGGRTMIYVEPTIRHGWRATAKRVFDIGLAGLIFVLTIPVQVAASILIKATSRGPVFFSQTRVGQNGELFEVIKFRTMVTNAEELLDELRDQNEVDGPLFKMKSDPRITKIGGVLRKFSIDELPQLYCVLLGSMSMVGPRPALPSEVAQWDDETCERLRVLPGLTGMWQVSGRSDSTFEVYKRMDLYYVDNWSLGHDLSICARTVGVVLKGSGAS